MTRHKRYFLHDFYHKTGDRNNEVFIQKIRTEYRIPDDSYGVPLDAGVFE